MSWAERLTFKKLHGQRKFQPPSIYQLPKGYIFFQILGVEKTHEIAKQITKMVLLSTTTRFLKLKKITFLLLQWSTRARSEMLCASLAVN